MTLQKISEVHDHVESCKRRFMLFASVFDELQKKVVSGFSFLILLMIRSNFNSASIFNVKIPMAHRIRTIPQNID